MGAPFYPLYLSALGRHDESISVARRALERDPVSPLASHMLSVQLYLARQFDRAVQQCHQTLEIDTGYGPALEVLGQIFSLTGLHQDAVVQLERSLVATQHSAWARALLGYAQARAGERKRAQEIIDELSAAAKAGFVPATCFALIYTGLVDTGLGESEQASSWLERACEERHGRLAYLRSEALWDPIRSDPRFGQVLQRARFPLL
jgi:adenylate cyclase